MLAWSSLSRISHFSAAGTMMRRARPGSVATHSRMGTSGSEATEKTENWLRTRSSSEGGWKKATNGSRLLRTRALASLGPGFDAAFPRRGRPPSSATPGASRASISVVKRSARSRARARRNAGGSRRCATRKSTHQTTPSPAVGEGRSVAKWSAT
jgi:hypothetical protein